MPTLQWVPSKKALAAGIVPTDYEKYNVDIDAIIGAELVAELAKFPVMRSVFTGAEIKLRHAYNNESASAWLAATKRDDEPIEDTVENRTSFLNAYRLDFRQKFVDGELGLRRAAVTMPKDELTVEMETITLNILREFAEKQGVPFTYNVVNARTLAAPYGDSGKTIGEMMAVLVDPEQSPKRSAKIRAEAQKILDQRAAAKAAMAEEDEDEDLAELAGFGADESDEAAD